MKKVFLLCAAAALLCACAANVKKINEVNASVWEQDPMNMCAGLIEQNKNALDAVRAKYGPQTASAVAPLYQELDLQSNAVCRMRIARTAQVERLKELREEYLPQINAVLSAYKAE